MDGIFTNILRKRGTRKILQKNFSEFFFQHYIETFCYFTTDIFLRTLLQTSSIFSTDLKKDIFFLLLDPRLSVKEWVGVYLALIHFFESYAGSFQQQSNNHNKIPV